ILKHLKGAAAKVNFATAPFMYFIMYKADGSQRCTLTELANRKAIDLAYSDVTRGVATPTGGTHCHSPRDLYFRPDFRMLMRRSE
ncbi:MAG: hypothetical protein Q4A64_07410, partial [Porphyromonadaceae bacterium]|nr:hypothetical protein [Porphyromonadaceae bacterium]